MTSVVCKYQNENGSKVKMVKLLFVPIVQPGFTERVEQALAELFKASTHSKPSSYAEFERL